MRHCPPAATVSSSCGLWWRILACNSQLIAENRHAVRQASDFPAPVSVLMRESGGEWSRASTSDAFHVILCFFFPLPTLGRKKKWLRDKDERRKEKAPEEPRKWRKTLKLNFDDVFQYPDLNGFLCVFYTSHIFFKNNLYYILIYFVAHLVFVLFCLILRIFISFVSVPVLFQFQDFFQFQMQPLLSNSILEGIV